MDTPHPAAPIRVSWHGQSLIVVAGRYPAGGAPFLQLKDGPEAYGIASVNLPDDELPEGHVHIKNWAENAGVLDALISAGVVGEPIGQTPTGFVSADICPLKVRIPDHARMLRESDRITEPES